MAVLKKRKQREIPDGFDKMSDIRFIRTSARKFIQVDLDYTDDTLFNKDVNSLIPNVKDAIVYISVKVRQDDLYRIDINAIKDAVKDSYYCRDIMPIIVKERSLRIKALRTTTTATDSVRAFVKTYKPKNMKKILLIAEEMIRELGIDEGQQDEN